VCQQEKHSTISFIDDAEDIEVQLIDMSTQLVSAAEQREEFQENLRRKQEKLRSNLTKVESEMESIDACLKKLRHTIACFHKMRRLFQANTAVFEGYIERGPVVVDRVGGASVKCLRFVGKKLKKTKEEIKLEVERALQLKSPIIKIIEPLKSVNVKFFSKKLKLRKYNYV
jgi:hypothetical protein